MRRARRAGRVDDRPQNGLEGATKRLLLLLGLTVVVTIGRTETAAAQVAVGVAAGLSVPTGDFGTAVHAGYHVTGIASRSPQQSRFGIQVEGLLHSFGVTGTGDFRILGATANVTAGTKQGAVRPYVIGGLGVYATSQESVDSPGRTAQFNTDVNGGGGLRLSVGQVAPCVEARVHSVSPRLGPRRAFVPMSVGILD